MSAGYSSGYYLDGRRSRACLCSRLQVARDILGRGRQRFYSRLLAPIDERLPLVGVSTPGSPPVKQSVSLWYGQFGFVHPDRPSDCFGNALRLCSLLPIVTSADGERRIFCFWHLSVLAACSNATVASTQNQVRTKDKSDAFLLLTCTTGQRRQGKATRLVSCKSDALRRFCGDGILGISLKSEIPTPTCARSVQSSRTNFLRIVAR